GRVVLADDPVAADAICAQLMGLDPEKVAHIREGSKFLGNSSLHLIDAVGEPARPPASPFQVVREFEYLHTV
ncbi:MAG TPA: hypothetical protein VF133_01710, partial [Terriglobales bacterium]